MKRLPLSGIIVPLVLTACNEANFMAEQQVAAVPSVQHIISDATHSAGTSGFFFLPPMVPQPAFAGTFDASLLPHTRVEVCELPAAACVSAGTVRVADDHYHVNWEASRTLDASRTYRIRVRVAGTLLGFADVRLARNSAELKDIDASQYVGVVLGQTLPIRFRIEEGAVRVAGPAGGSLSFAGGNVRITVPAGALSEPVGFTATAIASPSITGVVPGTSYQFGPADVTFAQPIAVTIQFDAAAVPASVDPSTLWLHKVVNGALVGAPDGDIASAPGSITGYVSGFSNWVVAASQVLIALNQAVSSLAQFVLDPASINITIQLRLALTQLLQLNTFPEFAALAGDFLNAASADACTAYTTVANAALNTSIGTYGDLVGAMNVVMTWYATVQTLGGSCSAPTPDAVFTKLSTDFTNFYNARLTGANYIAELPAATAELPKVYQLSVDAQRLGLSSLQNAIVNNAVNTAANQLRASAYNACRSTGDQAHLAALKPFVFAPYAVQQLVDDIQQCATSIDWQLVRPNGIQKASGHFGGGGTPGTAVTTAATRSLASGKLVLTGPVGVILCPDGSLINDELVIEFNGVDFLLHSPSANKFYAAPVEISLADLHSTGNVDPNDPGSYQLEIIRVSGGCNGAWTPRGPTTLATLTLQYPEIRVTVAPTQANVAANATHQFTETLIGSTQGVTWTATGGTVSNTGLFTAGSNSGDFKVRATSNEDPSAFGEADVKIQAGGFTIVGAQCSARADILAFAFGERISDAHFVTGPADCSSMVTQKNLAHAANDGSGSSYAMGASIDVDAGWSQSGGVATIFSEGSSSATSTTTLACSRCSFQTSVSSQHIMAVNVVMSSDHVIEFTGTGQATQCTSATNTAFAVVYKLPEFSIVAIARSVCSRGVVQHTFAPFQTTLIGGNTYRVEVQSRVQGGSQRSSSPGATNYDESAANQWKTKFEIRPITP